MRYLTIILTIGLLSCNEISKNDNSQINTSEENIEIISDSVDNYSEDLEGTWYIEKNQNLDGDVTFSHVSYKEVNGTHGFVAQNGNRIDFCESKSIELEQLDSQKWGGELQDCYEGLLHEILIYQIDSVKIAMVFVDNDHPFVVKDSILYSKHTNISLIKD